MNSLLLVERTQECGQEMEETWWVKHHVQAKPMKSHTTKVRSKQPSMRHFHAAACLYHWILTMSSEHKMAVTDVDNAILIGKHSKLSFRKAQYILFW